MGHGFGISRESQAKLFLMELQDHVLNHSEGLPTSGCTFVLHVFLIKHKSMQNSSMLVLCS